MKNDYIWQESIKTKNPASSPAFTSGRGNSGTTTQIYDIYLNYQRKLKYFELERIISKDRISPYLSKHSGDAEKALNHYKANIRISEAFYSLLSVLEIGLRNNIDNQLKRIFKVAEWYDHPDFIKYVSSFQIDRIQEARSNILREKKIITANKIVAELTFGFWTSLFDTKFDKTLWKDLRFAFPKCPKAIRQRKTICSKLNSIRKLRNRIFHHESISWSISALKDYRNEITETIDWLDGDLVNYFKDTFRIDKVLQNEEIHIK